MSIRLFSAQRIRSKSRNWHFHHFFLWDGNCWIYSLPHYLMYLFWPPPMIYIYIYFLLRMCVLLLVKSYSQPFSLRWVCRCMISIPLCWFSHLIFGVPECHVGSHNAVPGSKAVSLGTCWSENTWAPTQTWIRLSRCGARHLCIHKSYRWF